MSIYRSILFLGPFPCLCFCRESRGLNLDVLTAPHSFVLGILSPACSAWNAHPQASHLSLLPSSCRRLPPWPHVLTCFFLHHPELWIIFHIFILVFPAAMQFPWWWRLAFYSSLYILCLEWCLPLPHIMSMHWGVGEKEGRRKKQGRRGERKRGRDEVKKKEERREVWREAAAEIWNSTEELGIELKAIVGGGETLLIPRVRRSFLTVTHKGFWFVETRVLHTEDLHASCSSIMLFARVWINFRVLDGVGEPKTALREINTRQGTRVWKWPAH